MITNQDRIRVYLDYCFPKGNRYRRVTERVCCERRKAKAPLVYLTKPISNHWPLAGPIGAESGPRLLSPLPLQQARAAK